MKFGLLGLIQSDLSDVDFNKIRFAADLGFHGLGAHLTVPADQVSEAAAERTSSVIADLGLEFLQLWGVYPCIITPDEATRRAGVAGAREIVKLAAKMGVPGAGVRPTSLNPRGDWWPHPDNHSLESEDLFLRSLREIVETAEEAGVDVILETHVTTVLDSPERIRSIIQRTGSERVKLNLDPANFTGDLASAFNPTPLVNRLFDILGPYTDTVHVKDFYLEDRFIVHISETIPGEGMMDLDTVLHRTEELSGDMYAIIEHLPISQIPQAKRNLTEKATSLGIELG